MFKTEFELKIKLYIINDIYAVKIIFFLNLVI